jgi:hypothetical protein
MSARLKWLLRVGAVAASHPSVRLTRQRRIIALLLLAVWLPFYGHCATEPHCQLACVPAECAHHHDVPTDGHCPGEDAGHCHEHDFAPAVTKNLVPPSLNFEFPAWLTAPLVVPALDSEVVVGDARAPDESPPPHLIFAVAALPVRGPSLA